MHMDKLKTSDLMPLEQYARERSAVRTRVIAHKKNRQVAVGPHTTWLFEDRITIQYQVQEMLRAERVISEEGVVDELRDDFVAEGKSAGSSGATKSEKGKK